MSPYSGAAFATPVCPLIDHEAGDRAFGRLLLRDGIAVHLRAIAEDDVPEWLWRREPDEVALAVLPEQRRYRGEGGIWEMIDRVAGAWTYRGWKGGYFDAEQDARSFFDEVRWLFAHRKCGLDSARWRTSGVYWAYGIAADPSDGFLTDYRSGALRRGEPGDVPPHGMFINGVHESLWAEGGGWDLWRREARILGEGGQCGANVTDVPPDPSSRAMAGFVAIGDAAAGGLNGAPSCPPSSRRITVDGTHCGVLRMAGHGTDRTSASDLVDMGRGLALRHIQAIIDACAQHEARCNAATEPGTNAALRLALQSARQAMVPETIIQRTLHFVRQSVPVRPEEILGQPERAVLSALDAGCRGTTVIRLDDETLEKASRGEDGAAALVRSVAMSAWTSGDTGLHFDTKAATWNGCADSGSIRSAAGDGSFIFLDDTATQYATLNAPAFQLRDGRFDVDGFRHAATLMTLTLDISLTDTAMPTPRLARRIWEFRPISVSLSGIGRLLMAGGIPYDSEEGRAWCAGLCALMTGTALQTSAAMAEEMGPFPAWPENARSMRDVVERHRDAIRSSAISLLPAALAASIEVAWNRVLDRSRHAGFRNSYLSAISAITAETALPGGTAPGIAPASRVVHMAPMARGGFQKTIEPAVPEGLRALGYAGDEIDAVVRHVVGHGTLAHAPGVNHESLRKRGFTDTAIGAVEAALATTPDISSVFDPSILGEGFCRRMLGFTTDELGSEDFDMLAALGFSDAGIATANVFCCGADTVEGAPHLSPDHVAVFDCEEPQGERGRRQVSPVGVIRMMAAAQPFVSGGIGHAPVMPETATIEDCRSAFLLAWRLGLKSLVLRRREPEVADEGQRGAQRVGATRPGILPTAAARVPAAGPDILTPGSGSRAPARAIGDLPDGKQPLAAGSGTVIANDTDNVGRDAETSRGASSLAARSAASVPSSADAVVEQRQV